MAKSHGSKRKAWPTAKPPTYAARLHLSYLLDDQPITSAGLMILYEEGKFCSTIPFQNIFRNSKNPKVLVKPAGGKPYTIPRSTKYRSRSPPSHFRLTYNWNEDLGQM